MCITINNIKILKQSKILAANTGILKYFSNILKDFSNSLKHFSNITFSKLSKMLKLTSTAYF